VQRAAVALEETQLKLAEAEQRIHELENSVVKEMKDAETTTEDIAEDESQRVETAEMAAKNFEILFEIATSKLGAYEQEETKLRSALKSVENTEPTHRSCTLPRGIGCGGVHSVCADTASVASLETADSTSLKAEATNPMSHQETISTSLRSLLTKPSPKVRKKKKSPFRHFMKRSCSQESHLSAPLELPPICSAPKQCEDQPSNAVVEVQNKVKTGKTVQRAMSFADNKATHSKAGLVAFAKDIEKRFKRKRRSKTADFSDFSSQISEMTGCENVLCSQTCHREFDKY
jgi:hypothetical protein